MKREKEYSTLLLSWYDSNKRILPWRDNPTPYRVWISEIMLQQTRVETVIPYFDRFMASVPTIYDLAMIDDDVLNKLWEGLGYYSRARNLKKAAKQIISEFDGIIPSNKKDLESLSGIGPYTSGAISSIAFGNKDTAVDGNVLRVFARILAITENIKDKEIKQRIHKYVYNILPLKRVGDFNQSLMELGATVCLPNGVPKCIMCPVQKLCTSYKKELTSTIPIKQPKKKKKSSIRTVFLLKYKDEYALIKRPNKGLLAGLYEFPNIDEDLSLQEAKSYLQEHSILNISKLEKSKHVFTHLIWNMNNYFVVVSTKNSDYIWKTKSDIEDNLSIPTAFKTLKEYIIDS